MTHAVARGFEYYSARWKNAFAKNGAVPQQSPAFIAAEAHRTDRPPTHIIDTGGAFSAFRREGRVARCLIEGAGALVTGDEPFQPETLLQSAKEQMRADLLYLPLLYPDLSVAQALLNVDGIITLRRRPSSIISSPSDALRLHDRCRSRLGSRFRRRIKNFEKSGLRFDTITGARAVDALNIVERNSWKAAVQQDMHSRDQFDVYAARILAGELSMAVVFAEYGPIAYRLDMVIKDTLFAMKWSFDEAWKHASPGFALMVLDLPQRCAALGISSVDLYGAPDQLKNALATHSRERIELVWPDCALARQILEERSAHDARAEKALQKGCGIWAAYPSAKDEHR